jgi:ubiquinone/menaquinone biosynthesis C-methylase UbiE
VLEVGCGAGLTAVALAQQGFQVDAIDSVPRMVELTREKVTVDGVGERLHIRVADVHSLDFEAETFELALALGVVPWLHSPPVALQELGRTLKPGGHLIVNADNRARLTSLLDPRFHPSLATARRTAKHLLNRFGVRRRSVPQAIAHSREEFDRLLEAAGLETVSRAMVGFGPFTLFGRRLLPQRLGVEVHRRLQRYADRNVALLRSTGAQYLVLARKTRV